MAGSSGLQTTVQDVYHYFALSNTIHGHVTARIPLGFSGGSEEVFGKYDEPACLQISWQANGSQQVGIHI
jgi:hypothetical protein